MTKLYTSLQRVIGALACWSLLAGIAPAQQDQHQPLNQPAPGPAARANPNCWPAPCIATEDPDAKHDFENYLTPPRMAWYAEMDGAAIQGKPQNRTDLLSNGVIGNIVMSTGDFSYDFQAAGRLLVGVTLDDCFQVEASYFRVNTAENDEAIRNSDPNGFGNPVPGTGNLYTPFSGFGASPPTAVDLVDFATMKYTSSYQGGEINVRRQMPCPPGRMTMSILGGVRYAEIDEDFQFNTQTTTVPGAGTNNFHIVTGNQMIGGQLGALFELYLENRWWVDCEVKGAFFSNRQHLISEYQTIPAGGVATNFITSDQEIHTSFAEDITLSLVYRWSAHCSTRVGYTATFIQDVALAPENLGSDLSILQQGPAVVSHNQNMIYMGPVAGLMLAW
jgi:hypothetical protein